MAGFSYDAGKGEAGRASSPSREEPSADWGPTASGGDAQASLDASDGARSNGPSASSSDDDHAAGQGGDGPVGSDGGAASHAEGGSSGGAGHSGNAGAGAAGKPGGGAGGSNGRGGSSGAGGASGRGGTSGTSARGGSAGRAGGGSGGEHDDGGAGGAGRAERALLISEYVEGPHDKAIEIRALATSSLDGCELLIHSNGATEGKGVALAGELAEGHTYVICSTDLVEQLGAVCARKFGLATFNGNDAVTLECDGAVLDAIGQVGFEPKTAWTGSDVSTADQVLRRRCSVTHGDTVATDPFDPSLEWQSHPLEDLTGLGAPDCD